VTRLLLVRHAESEGLGRRLSGRLPGSPLTGTGRRQAAALAARLSSLSLDAVVSSPLERAMDTATAMAARGRREVAVDDAFTEVDFGTWAGAAFSELVGQAEWDRWNSERSRARCPGGESMAEVQDRAAAGVERWTRTLPDGLVAVVSHADVIRALLARYLGLSLDSILRLEVAPASVSAIEVSAANSPRVLCVNHTGDLPGM
jgi:probable phosphomutase (TIGR03848 family)